MGYVILWLVAAAIGELYFLLDQNASRKRAVFPVFMFGLIGAFVVILSFLGAPAGVLIFCTICGVAIALVSINRVRFCDNCGATVGLFKTGISPAEKYSRCDAPLRK